LREGFIVQALNQKGSQPEALPEKVALRWDVLFKDLSLLISLMVAHFIVWRTLRRPHRPIHRHQAHRHDYRGHRPGLEDERFMKNLLTAILMTIVTTALLGLAYPLAVTGLARVIFPDQADGQLIKQEDGTVIGSALIGQPFSAPGYFHSRPSAAGVAGYDARASSGSNLGPTNRKLIDRMIADVRRLQSENPGQPVPVDLVTTSGSGLDPHISPAAAEFQLPRVARERGMSEEDVRRIVAAHTEGRQFGFLGEARVNVLRLNLDLDRKKPMATRSNSLTAAAP
jgi:potassium-transporting ATPase KdpC subunit